MSKAIEVLTQSLNRAMTVSPKVGGFPYLAEVLRQAGVHYNYWFLPSLQSIYVTKNGSVVDQGTPLLTGFADIPAFNQDALIHALREDQAGKSTFPEFLTAIWQAGVIRYEVDFSNRTVSYFGSDNKSYVESYPFVEI
jgi:uncharacterized protein YbcV (DUF1398 family)